jgi:hypothetical protein
MKRSRWQRSKEVINDIVLIRDGQFYPTLRLVFPCSRDMTCFLLHLVFSGWFCGPCTRHVANTLQRSTVSSWRTWNCFSPFISSRLPKKQYYHVCDPDFKEFNFDLWSHDFQRNNTTTFVIRTLKNWPLTFEVTMLTFNHRGQVGSSIPIPL